MQSIAIFGLRKCLNEDRKRFAKRAYLGKSTDDEGGIEL